MTDRKRNVLTGLFVFAGLCCMAVLIVMFGEYRGFFGKRYTISAKFDRITGVREGTDVTLSGVWVGSVLKVGLVDPLQPHKGVLTVLEIDPKFQVPGGSVAVVTTPLMGQATVNITPAAKTLTLLPTDGTAEIAGMVTTPLGDVIDPALLDTMKKTTYQIGVLAEALTPAANAITDLLEQRSIDQVEKSAGTPQKMAANLFTTVERLHNVLRHFDLVLGDPVVQSNVKETLANFKAASEDAKLAVAGLRNFAHEAQQVTAGAKGVMGKLDSTADTTQKYIDELGRRLVGTTDQVSKLLDYLISASRDLAEGQGTAGMLLRDPKFYDELMLTVRRLGEAATELQVLVKQWQKQGILSSGK